jgi:hypothetical protein
MSKRRAQENAESRPVQGGKWSREDMLLLATLARANGGKVPNSTAAQLGRGIMACKAKYQSIRTYVLHSGMTLDEMKEVARTHVNPKPSYQRVHVKWDLDRLREYAITDQEASEIGNVFAEAEARRDEVHRLEQVERERLHREALAPTRDSIRTKLSVKATPLAFQQVELEWQTPYVCVLVSNASETHYYKIKAEEFPWTPAEMRNRELFDMGALAQYLDAKVERLSKGILRADLVLSMDGCTLIFIRRTD